MADATGEPLTVLHIIGGLQKGGGAEEMLYRLVLANSHNKHIVMSLLDEGYYGPQLRTQGVEVLTIGLRRHPLALLRIFSVFLAIRRTAPDVVQTWMYYSDFIGGVCARLAGVRDVVWGLHNSTLDVAGSTLSTRVFARLCAWCSGFVPKKIISCSRAGVESHIRLGYSPGKMRVVHNGYDLSEFTDREGSLEPAGTPPDGNRSLREEFHLRDDVVCLGMVARFDAQKDHENLFRALQRLSHACNGRWVCFLFGRFISDNAQLNELLAKYELQDNVITYGLSVTIAAHLRQLDIHVLSSRFGEAFPNVLNEAMASKVPCIATDVGDSGFIVGDCGWIVPASDPQALADAMTAAISELKQEPERWAARRSRCRQRIENNFSIERMTQAYEQVWESARL